MPIKDIFRKYDIRGTVDKDFEINDFYAITKAIILYLKQKNPNLKNIALGMDGRLHSPALKDQVTNSLIDSGINVIFLGLCPTPSLYYAAYNLDVDAAIMITASHNPGKDNGLKILLGKDSIWAKDIEKIYELYEQKMEIVSNEKGSYMDHPIIEEYINYIVNQFTHLKNIEINAILDCSNGTAGTVLPIMIEKMNWKNFDLLYSEVDGNFPNHEPDPTIEKNINDLKVILDQNKNIEFALGLDGDCDRLCVVTKNGFLVPGDQLLAIFSKFLSKNQGPRSIVFDVKCSNGLIELCQNNNIATYITPTGHAYIKEEMKKNNAMLGGELSGHYCFNDRYFGFDDAIYAIFRLIEVIYLNNKKIEELLEEFPKKISTKEIRISCPESKKAIIIDDVKKKLSTFFGAKIIEIDGIRMDMPYGWGILRASNTEPMLSIRFEGNNNEDLLKIKRDFFEAILPHFDQNILKEKLEL